MEVVFAFIHPSVEECNVLHELQGEALNFYQKIIMVFAEHERRALMRRLVDVSVVCCPSGRRCGPQDWIFGRTVDVSEKGLKIRSRETGRLEIGVKLDLLIVPSGGRNSLPQEETPACLPIRVIRVEKALKFFVVEYIS